MGAAGSPLLLGIDLGTSALKAGLFGPDGQLTAQARRSYPLHAPRPGWAEENPADWWAALCAAVHEALAQAARPGTQVTAIGLAGQAPGQVLLDARGHALGRALIWQDRRAAGEAAWLASQVTPEQLHAWTGVREPDPSLAPARLRWLQTHRPEDWARTAMVLSPKDYLAFSLTGEQATDPHSAFGLLGPSTGRYEPGLFDLLQVDRRRLPPLLAPTAIVGHVTSRAAAETGLSAGTPVVLGTVDAWCAIIGSGARAAEAVDVAGTSEVVALVTARPAAGEGVFQAPLIEELHWVGGPTQSGSSALAWLARGFYPEFAGSADFARLEGDAASVSAGSDGLVFLPYLAGERAPLWDARARGALIGLTLGHTRAHATRAVYEGVALAVRHILSLAEEAAHGPATLLRLVGGGAESAFWNQLKADVTGKPALEPAVAEAGCLGAAILAAIGTGTYPGCQAATRAMVQIRRAYEPDRALSPHYDELFAIYRGLYPALRPWFWRLEGV